MFGKRAPRPASRRGTAASAAPVADARRAGRRSAARPRADRAAAAAPSRTSRRDAAGAERPTAQSEDYYQTKSTIFGALIETIDLSQLAKLDAEAAREEIRDIVNEIIAIKNVVMSIAEQEELLEDICNDVLGYGPLEPLLARDDIADIMVNGAGTDLHRSRRQGPADQHPLPRQPRS